ncbi:DUF2610 domain-containing protein [Embleya sp. NBC_00896]|uniref:DUF2610 domain-containing protein n=1 Tax=Embleya sp. NBC_00896 TaxID=2975961 RepID=UPI002F918EC6|nr:DUF2610 domain-containing protein [Embleya sp. NBC_00896]
MRPFDIPCRFEDTTLVWTFYVGEPAADAHPLEQQLAWLERERGGELAAPEMANAFAELHRIARQEGVGLEDLAAFAWREAGEEIRRFGH